VAEKVRTPFLIMHGSRDRVVRPEQSAALKSVLDKNGVSNERHVFDGEDHPIDRTKREDLFGLLGKWFEKHLNVSAGPVDATPPAARKAPSSRAGPRDATSGEPQWVKEPIEAQNTYFKTFTSPTIGREVSYLVYLPAEYEDSGEQRYPVMYWLHGIGGAQTGLPRYIKRLDDAIQSGNTPAMIVVFVNGVRDSFFCDSADGKTPVESVIINDLIPHVDASYRTISAREGRIIEGFSMGGFGAAHLAFKYPERFGAVSLLDAALLDLATMQRRHEALYQRIFGGRPETFIAEHPRTLLEKNVSAIRGRMKVRLAVGALVQGNRSLHEDLTRLGVVHDYDTFEGAGHSHAPILDRLGEKNWAFYRAALGGT
jgi:enterochelin esterase-like enzyme